MQKNGTKFRYTNTDASGALQYTVACKRRQYNFTVRSATTQIAVRDLTRDRSTAVSICDLFAASAVYPESVLEILDDLLGVTLLS